MDNSERTFYDITSNNIQLRSRRDELAQRLDKIPEGNLWDRNFVFQEIQKVNMELDKAIKLGLELSETIGRDKAERICREIINKFKNQHSY